MHADPKSMSFISAARKLQFKKHRVSHITTKCPKDGTNPTLSRLLQNRDTRMFSGLRVEMKLEGLEEYLDTRMFSGLRSQCITRASYNKLSASSNWQKDSSKDQKYMTKIIKKCMRHQKQIVKFHQYSCHGCMLSESIQTDR